jgi:hypothetical protein
MQIQNAIENADKGWVTVKFECEIRVHVSSLQDHLEDGGEENAKSNLRRFLEDKLRNDGSDQHTSQFTINGQPFEVDNF